MGVVFDVTISCRLRTSQVVTHVCTCWQISMLWCQQVLWCTDVCWHQHIFIRMLCCITTVCLCSLLFSAWCWCACWFVYCSSRVYLNTTSLLQTCNSVEWLRPQEFLCWTTNPFLDTFVPVSFLESKTGESKTYLKWALFMIAFYDMLWLHFTFVQFVFIHSPHNLQWQLLLV